MSKRVTSSAQRERGADAPARPPLVQQASQRRLSDAHEALQRTLEEVELAERELAQQNEELIAAREALEVERHRYRELFELAPDGYVISNAQGIVEEANQAAAALLRTSDIALRGKPLAVFVAPPGRQAFRSLLREVAIELGGPCVHRARLSEQVERDVGERDVVLQRRCVRRPLREPVGEHQAVVGDAHRVDGRRVDDHEGHSCWTSLGIE